MTRFVSTNIVGGDRGGGGGARRRRSFQQQTQEGEETLHDVNDQDDQLQQQQQQQLTNRQRSSSLSSFHHHQSSSSSSPAELLHEPGWFSHAFHGSGACTCSLLAGSHQLDDHHHPALSPTPVDENTNGDAAKIDGNNDHGDNNNNRGNSTNKDTTKLECNPHDDHERNDIVDGSTVVEVRRPMESCGDETKRREEEIGSRDDTKVTKEEDATEWEWNDNIRVHDIYEVVNHHHHPTPSTAFSDEPSLLLSSLSSSSCASNNNEQKHHNNDNNKYINDELITKVGDLAEENGVLMNKCKMLEEELSVMMTKQKPPTMMQKEEQHSLDDCENNSNSNNNNNNNNNKAMMFMAAISTTMMESFRVGNANLRNLSSLLSTATSTTNHHHSSNTPIIDQSIESTAAVAITTNSDIMMKPITEMRHEEVLEMIQDMQTENDALHKSMKDSMLSAFSDVREQMATMIESHNTTVEEYTSQINSLRRELNVTTSARDALASEIITLKNENTSMAIRVEEAMEEVATEFGAKIATLTNDLNESNLSQHELSKDMELLKKENHKLSMELEEARSLVIASVHDEMKQELLSKDTRNSENEEQALEMERLKNDNGIMQESVKEMKSLIATLINKLSEESASLKDAQESYEQQGEELNVEKMANTYLREEIDCISTEREEAYDACKVLQQEINLLRQKCAKLDEERFDSDDSIPSSASDGNITSSNNEDKLSELSKMNESLTKELEHKTEALQAVQSVLTSLKEEQSIIKKTITELRTENAALRDTSTSSKTKTNSLPPLVPPPPPKSTSLKHKTSLDSSSESTSSSTQSQILQLEVRLQKVEKENKGLREANNIMSTKLFDEMEKTESLKIANEGLGARICKLVKFIQQNSGGGSCAGEGAASSVVGASISGKSR